MRRLTFIISLLTLSILYSYAQDQDSILSNALQIYQKELPDLQKTIFKKFCRLYKKSNIRKNDINKYEIIVAPTFKLNENFIQYNKGDILINYIDFESMWDSFDGYLFKDSSYIGYLRYDKKFSFFDPAIDSNLAWQIRDFKPDMVFYPDCNMILCCIKDGKFYIAEMVKSTECVFLTEKEYIKKYPDRLERLSKMGFPELKHYLLKNGKTSTRRSLL